MSSSSAPSKDLRTIVEPDVDLVGFDPRGVGYSAPALDCFKSRDEDEVYSEDRRTRWYLKGEYLEPYSVDDKITLNIMYHRDSAISQLCAQRDQLLAEGSIFKYASTPYVATDMLGIIDAWSQWRNGEQLTPDINFWGFSYGSVLGSTFAAMFPDRVGNLMIDGIVDSKEWYDGDLVGDYVDAEKILAKFGVYCKAAGKKCGMYRRGESAMDINLRLHKVLHSLKSDPIAQIPFVGRPEVLTHGYLMSWIFTGLYDPMYSFPDLANATAEIESENRTLNTDIKHYSIRGFTSMFREANTAVICSDQQNRVSRLINCSSVALTTPFVLRLQAWVSESKSLRPKVRFVGAQLQKGPTSWTFVRFIGQSSCRVVYATEASQFRLGRISRPSRSTP